MPSLRFDAHVLRRWSAIFALVLATALVVGGVRAGSRWFVFPGSRVAWRSPPRAIGGLTVTARDGVVARALHLDGPAGAPVFVYFHNNRQTMVDGLELASDLVRRGFGVVLPEYRGYGLSRAEEPTEEGLYEDADAVLDGLNARHVGPERIVLCGMSLGTGVAAEMARRGRGAALVLIAPYTSLPDVVSDAVPLLPSALLMPDKFETLKKSTEIRVPTVIVHGDADEVIPFRMGRTLAGAITGARLLRVHGGHHGDLFARAHEPIVGAMTALALDVARRAVRTE